MRQLRDSIGGEGEDILVAVPIIRTTGRFGSRDDVSLLQQGLEKKRAYGIKIAAGKAIREIAKRAA